MLLKSRGADKASSSAGAAGTSADGATARATAAALAKAKEVIRNGGTQAEAAAAAKAVARQVLKEQQSVGSTTLGSEAAGAASPSGNAAAKPSKPPPAKKQSSGGGLIIGRGRPPRPAPSSAGKRPGGGAVPSSSASVVSKGGMSIMGKLRSKKGNTKGGGKKKAGGKKKKNAKGKASSAKGGAKKAGAVGGKLAPVPEGRDDSGGGAQRRDSESKRDVDRPSQGGGGGGGGGGLFSNALTAVVRTITDESGEEDYDDSGSYSSSEYTGDTGSYTTNQSYSTYDQSRAGESAYSRGDYSEAVSASAASEAELEMVYNRDNMPSIFHDDASNATGAASSSKKGDKRKSEDANIMDDFIKLERVMDTDDKEKKRKEKEREEKEKAAKEKKEKEKAAKAAKEAKEAAAKEAKQKEAANKKASSGGKGKKDAKKVPLPSPTLSESVGEDNSIEEGYSSSVVNADVTSGGDGGDNIGFWQWLCGDPCGTASNSKASSLGSDSFVISNNSRDRSESVGESAVSAVYDVDDYRQDDKKSAKPQAAAASVASSNMPGGSTIASSSVRNSVATAGGGDGDAQSKAASTRNGGSTVDNTFNSSYEATHEGTFEGTAQELNMKGTKSVSWADDHFLDHNEVESMGGGIQGKKSTATGGNEKKLPGLGSKLVLSIGRSDTNRSRGTKSTLTKSTKGPAGSTRFGSSKSVGPTPSSMSSKRGAGPSGAASVAVSPAKSTSEDTSVSSRMMGMLRGWGGTNGKPGGPYYVPPGGREAGIEVIDENNVMQNSPRFGGFGAPHPAPQSPPNNGFGMSQLRPLSPPRQTQPQPQPPQQQQPDDNPNWRDMVADDRPMNSRTRSTPSLSLQQQQQQQQRGAYQLPGYSQQQHVPYHTHTSQVPTSPPISPTSQGHYQGLGGGPSSYHQNQHPASPASHPTSPASTQGHFQFHESQMPSSLRQQQFSPSSARGPMFNNNNNNMNNGVGGMPSPMNQMTGQLDAAQGASPHSYYDGDRNGGEVGYGDQSHRASSPEPVVQGYTPNNGMWQQQLSPPSTNNVRGINSNLSEESSVAGGMDRYGDDTRQRQNKTPSPPPSQYSSPRGGGSVYSHNATRSVGAMNNGYHRQQRQEMGSANFPRNDINRDVMGHQGGYNPGRSSNNNSPETISQQQNQSQSSPAMKLLLGDSDSDKSGSGQHHPQYNRVDQGFGGSGYTAYNHNMHQGQPQPQMPPTTPQRHEQQQQQYYHPQPQAARQANAETSHHHVDYNNGMMHTQQQHNNDHSVYGMQQRPELRRMASAPAQPRQRNSSPTSYNDQNGMQLHQPPQYQQQQYQHQQQPPPQSPNSYHHRADSPPNGYYGSNGQVGVPPQHPQQQQQQHNMSSPPTSPPASGGYRTFAA